MGRTNFGAHGEGSKAKDDTALRITGLKNRPDVGEGKGFPRTLL